MKTIQIFKAVITGILIGAAVFFIPFPFRFFFIFFFIFFAFRFFSWSRWRSRYPGNHYSHFWNPSYTQRWQSMSEEERKKFVKKMESELFTSHTETE